MTEREAALARDAAAQLRTAPEFYEQMKRANVAPLWDRYNRATPPEPGVPDPGLQYRWADLLPLVDRAAREISVADGQLRELMLINPAFGGRTLTTTGLFAGVQILNPGESARQHRHTTSAFRFVMEGRGAVTVVNGEPCAMEPGDVVLQPNWTWHGHHHPGIERCSWFDGLDLPITDFFDVWFVENERADLPLTVAAESGKTDAAFGAGLAPATTRAPLGLSTKFRYSWAEVATALSATPAERDGTRLLRYTDPTTGGPVMWLIDLYVLDLPQGVETRPRRTTSNALCVVVAGEGETRSGERVYKWVKNDIFTLPHWRWVTHRARTPGARLFLHTDRELLRRLGLLREELG